MCVPARAKFYLFVGSTLRLVDYLKKFQVHQVAINQLERGYKRHLTFKREAPTLSLQFDFIQLTSVFVISLFCYNKFTGSAQTIGFEFVFDPSH